MIVDVDRDLRRDQRRARVSVSITSLASERIDEPRGTEFLDDYVGPRFEIDAQQEMLQECVLVKSMKVSLSWHGSRGPACRFVITMIASPTVLSLPASSRTGYYSFGSI